MELHHMVKSTQSIQNGVTFKPIMQSKILVDLDSFLLFADPSKQGSAMKAAPSIDWLINPFLNAVAQP